MCAISLRSRGGWGGRENYGIRKTTIIVGQIEALLTQHGLKHFFQTPLKIGGAPDYRISCDSESIGSVSFLNNIVGIGRFSDHAWCLRITGPFGQGYNIVAEHDSADAARLEYNWREGCYISGAALSRPYYITPLGRSITKKYNGSETVVAIDRDFTFAEISPAIADLPEAALLLILGMANVIYSNRLPI